MGVNRLRLLRIDIRAETTKTKEKAPLDIFDKELEDFIRDSYQDSSNHQAPNLFLNRQNKKINQRCICKYLKQTSKNIIGVQITPHYFRHRFCTECGKKNLSIPDVKAISGIKDTDVLLKYYTHSTIDGKAKVLEATRI
ncbi:MAG: tyrosine-type recombinase/integrase [Candidatus Omnitrophica bacterium]|nr:tyrosine-type recombinase/integrase [Candidatus Omnitrophota bacterium]